MKTSNHLTFLICLLMLLFITACAEIIEKSINNNILVVTAPVNNLISTDSVQTFYWEKLSDATFYQLQIVSPRFDSIRIFVADTVVQNNYLLFHLVPGNYQWRVRGNNQNSSTAFSDPRDISIN